VYKMTLQLVGDAENQGKAHEYGRPTSIEDASNRYFIHPISDWIVAVGIKLELSPNFVSLLGLGCGVISAFLYYQLPQPAFVVGAFIAMLGWHVLDGADGRLARATGKTSAFGRIIDGICDHLVFGAVYIALALHLVETGFPIGVWWLVLGAGISHGVQAAAYEERRQKYQRRIDGISRDKVQESLLVVDGKKSTLAGSYDFLQKLVGGNGADLDNKLVTLNGGIEGKRLADSIVARTVPMVKAWGLLNANNRTFLIFVFAFIGQPALFFAFELLVLNFVLIVLLVAERQLEKTLVSEANIAIPPK
jgi:CDP-diacylglycerol---serine O-phosphatidyltransferase